MQTLIYQGSAILYPDGVPVAIGDRVRFYKVRNVFSSNVSRQDDHVDEQGTVESIKYDPYPYEPCVVVRFATPKVWHGEVRSYPWLTIECRLTRTPAGWITEHYESRDLDGYQSRCNPTRVTKLA